MAMHEMASLLVVMRSINVWLREWLRDEARDEDARAPCDCE